MIERDWKLFVQNVKESYHIATVHRNTINTYASARSSGYWVKETAGEYLYAFAQYGGSMAPSQGDDRIPVNERLARLHEAGGTITPLIYPAPIWRARSIARGICSSDHGDDSPIGPDG
jgi:choline monooxygenase